MSMGQQLNWLVRDIIDPATFVWDFFAGFFDNGASFENGIMILH